MLEINRPKWKEKQPLTILMVHHGSQGTRRTRRPGGPYKWADGATRTKADKKALKQANRMRAIVKAIEEGKTSPKAK